MRRPRYHIGEGPLEYQTGYKISGWGSLEKARGAAPADAPRRRPP
jgi:hypothetical protein